MRYLRQHDYSYKIAYYDLETLIDGDYSLLERTEIKARVDCGNSLLY